MPFTVRNVVSFMNISVRCPQTGVRSAASNAIHRASVALSVERAKFAPTITTITNSTKRDNELHENALILRRFILRRSSRSAHFLLPPPPRDREKPTNDARVRVRCSPLILSLSLFLEYPSRFSSLTIPSSDFVLGGSQAKRGNPCVERSHESMSRVFRARFRSRKGTGRDGTLSSLPLQSPPYSGLTQVRDSDDSREADGPRRLHTPMKDL